MGLATLSPAVRLDKFPSEPAAARPTMLGAAVSDAGSLAVDFVEPFLRMIAGAAVSGAAGCAFTGVAELAAGAVFVAGAVAVFTAALVAVEEAEGLELAEGASAPSLSESSLAALLVDGPEFAACD